MPVERRTEGVGLALWWTRQRDRNYLRQAGRGGLPGPGTDGPRVEPGKPEGRRSSLSGGENRKERPIVTPTAGYRKRYVRWCGRVQGRNPLRPTRSSGRQESRPSQWATRKSPLPVGDKKVAPPNGRQENRPSQATRKSPLPLPSSSLPRRLAKSSLRAATATARCSRRDSTPMSSPNCPTPTRRPDVSSGRAPCSAEPRTPASMVRRGSNEPAGDGPARPGSSTPDTLAVPPGRGSRPPRGT